MRWRQTKVTLFTGVETPVKVDTLLEVAIDCKDISDQVLRSDSVKELKAGTMVTVESITDACLKDKTIRCYPIGSRILHYIKPEFLTIPS